MCRMSPGEAGIAHRHSAAECWRLTEGFMVDTRADAVVPRMTSSGRTRRSPKKAVSPRIDPMRDWTAIVEISSTS